MDEAVIKYYRRLLRNGFDNAGSCESPSIYLDSVGENIPICGQIGRDYMHLYITVNKGVIEDIKYLCTCDPTANVVVEILCCLIRGKTLAQAAKITEESFVEVLGTRDEDFLKKSRGILQLLNRGISRYQEKAT
jgi:NifU-like protein involved in Fe-S cluster formation